MIPFATVIVGFAFAFLACFFCLSLLIVLSMFVVVSMHVHQVWVSGAWLCSSSTGHSGAYFVRVQVYLCAAGIPDAFGSCWVGMDLSDFLSHSALGACHLAPATRLCLFLVLGPWRGF